MRRVTFIVFCFLCTGCDGGATPLPDLTSDTSDASTTDALLHDAQDSDAEPEDTLDVSSDGAGADVVASEVDASVDASPVEDVVDPTALPSEPAPIIMQVISPSSVQTEMEEPAVFVSALSPEGRLVQTEAAVYVAKNALYLEADVPAGIIQAATEHGPWNVFGTSQGLWVLENDFFFASPMNELFVSSDVRSVFSVMDGDNAGLWIGQSDGVLLWEDDTLFDIDVDDLVWEAPVMSYGALYEGKPALWIADQELVMALIPQDDSIVAVTVLEGRAVSHMTSDGGGSLWMISDGTIIKRAPLGALTWLSHDEAFTGLLSSQGHNDTWLRSAAGLVWWSDGVFAAVENTSSLDTAAPVGPGTLLASNQEQTLLISMDGSVPIVTTNWTDQIQPLYEAKCSTCHSPDNIASDFSAPLAWQENIDEILVRVTVDMPANDPPLAPALVALIESWKEGGFLP